MLCSSSTYNFYFISETSFRKSKVKLSPCLTKDSAMKTYWGEKV